MKHVVYHAAYHRESPDVLLVVRVPQVGNPWYSLLYPGAEEASGCIRRSFFTTNCHHSRAPLRISSYSSIRSRLEGTTELEPNFGQWPCPSYLVRNLLHMEHHCPWSFETTSEARLKGGSSKIKGAWKLKTPRNAWVIIVRPCRKQVSRPASPEPSTKQKRMH